MAITAEELAARAPRSGSGPRRLRAGARSPRRGLADVVREVHRRPARPAARDRARRRGSPDPRGCSPRVPERLRARGGRRPPAGEGDARQGAGHLGGLQQAQHPGRRGRRPRRRRSTSSAASSVCWPSASTGSSSRPAPRAASTTRATPARRRSPWSSPARGSTGSTARRCPCRTGDFLRFDPETTRCPVAGPEGLTLIAIGAPRGAYEPRGPF